jgi:tRNA (cmo5U34)-methyltransferase
LTPAGSLLKNSTMGIDKIFADSNGRTADFTFGEETAAVFDDMLFRSVPFYDEMQRMIVELAKDFAVDGTAIYDVGCSTGHTLRALDAIPQGIRLVGIDNSEAMLAKAEENLAGSLGHPYSLICCDLNQGLRVHDASVVVMCLTLQFVRPLYRQRLIEEVREGLRDFGALVLVEKVLAEESTLNRLYIEHYYEFKKRNGYSEIEISRKREALENVLIPYRQKENEEMLRHVGFRAVDVFFKWYNFAGIIALK